MKRELFLHFLEQEAKRVALDMACFRDTYSLGEKRGQAPAAEKKGKHSERQGRDLPVSVAKRSQKDPASGPHGFSPLYYYPFLFSSAFPVLSLKTLRTIAIANRILLEAILLTDRHMDTSLAWTPENLCLVNACYHRALEMLMPLFPPDHPLWEETETYFLEYGQAVIRERTNHRYRLSPYSDSEFSEISSGKVSLLKTTLRAMSLLSKTQDHFIPLTESQRCFLVGFQAFDDLKDWKEDRLNHNFTQLLTKAIYLGGFESMVLDGKLPTSKALGQVLYYRGLAAEQLLRAEQFFQDALEPLKGVHVPMWVEIIDGFLTNCRAMRADLAEIRRREEARTRRTRPPASQKRKVSEPSERKQPAPLPAAPVHNEGHDSLQRAAAFLIKCQPPHGGFVLYRSPYSYINPAHPLAPSTAVTRMILLLLDPLRGLLPPLAPVCRKAARWLHPPGKGSRSSVLPSALEEAFCTSIHDHRQFPSLDNRFARLPSPIPNGLFWAHLLLKVSKQGGRMPQLESYAKRCIRHASFTAWTRGGSPTDTRTGEQAPSACRPLLPLFLLCQALGPQLLQPALQEPLHEHLLGRYAREGTWGNITETALSLLCLLLSGYKGDGLVPARERLMDFQEEDGSWPANTIYEEGKTFFGSRELSTSLCMQALFLSSLCGHPSGVKNRETGASRKGPASRVILHPGVPEGLRKDAQGILARCREFLPSFPLGNIYLGRWPSMPAHFLLPQEKRIHAGINLWEKGQPSAQTTGRRPLDVEIVLALSTAARYSLRGPFRDRLERIYIAGLALWLVQRLFPQRPFRVLAGMPELHVRWCRENEGYLWEQVKLFLHHPSRNRASHRWLIPDQDPPSTCPIPRGASFAIGQMIFLPTRQEANLKQQVRKLVEQDRKGILQAFRVRAGLDSGLPNHAS